MATAGVYSVLPANGGLHASNKLQPVADTRDTGQEPREGNSANLAEMCLNEFRLNEFQLNEFHDDNAKATLRGSLKLMQNISLLGATDRTWNTDTSSPSRPPNSSSTRCKQTSFNDNPQIAWIMRTREAYLPDVYLRLIQLRFSGEAVTVHHGHTRVFVPVNPP